MIHHQDAALANATMMRPLLSAPSHILTTFTHLGFRSIALPTPPNLFLSTHAHPTRARLSRKYPSPPLEPPPFWTPEILRVEILPSSLSLGGLRCLRYGQRSRRWETGSDVRDEVILAVHV